MEKDIAEFLDKVIGVMLLAILWIIYMRNSGFKEYLLSFPDANGSIWPGLISFIIIIVVLTVSIVLILNHFSGQL